MIGDQSLKQFVEELKSDNEQDAAHRLNKFIDALQIESPYTQLIATRLGLNLDFFRNVSEQDFRSTDPQISQMKFHHYAYKKEWGREIMQVQKTIKHRKNIFDVSGQDFHFVTQTKSLNLNLKDFQEVEYNYNKIYNSPQSQRALLQLYENVTYNSNNIVTKPIKGQLEVFSDLTNHINKFLMKFEKRKRVMKNLIIQDIQVQKKQADYTLQSEEQKERMREFFKREHDKQTSTVTQHLQQVEDKQNRYQASKREEIQIYQQQKIENEQKQKKIQQQLQVQQNINLEKSESKKIDNKFKQQRSLNNRISMNKITSDEGIKMLEYINEKNQIVENNLLEGRMKRAFKLKQNSQKNNCVIEAGANNEVQTAQKKIQTLVSKMDGHQQTISQNYFNSYEDWNNKQLKAKDQKERAKEFNMTQQLDKDNHFASQSELGDSIINKRMIRENLIKSSSNMRKEINKQRQEDFQLSKERVNKLDDINNERLLNIIQRKCDRFNDRQDFKEIQREKTIKGYQLQNQYEAELNSNLKQVVHQIFNDQVYHANFQIHENQEKQTEQFQTSQIPEISGQKQLTMVQKYAKLKKNNAVSVLSSVLENKDIENLLLFKNKYKQQSTTQ